MKVLVTGGAGFIGSHIVDALVSRGDEVRILDALVPEVHGIVTATDAGVVATRFREGPGPNVGFHWGNVTNMEAVGAAMDGCEAVIHCAARLGVERSFADPSLFVRENTLGTALVLEAARAMRVNRVVIASSMGVYGEGMCECPGCGDHEHPRIRSAQQMADRQWELTCSVCGAALTSLQTDESTGPDPGSPYSLTKYDQEQLARQLAFQGPSGFGVTVLRYFNVYGPRQAMNNPYSGVAAIFATALLYGMQPMVYEDGQQTRDFTHVSDVVRANLLALDAPTAGHVINVATGIGTPVADLARVIARRMRERNVPVLRHPQLAAEGVDQMMPDRVAASLEPIVLQQGRVGDVRHCVANIAASWKTIGYRPRIALEDGVDDLVEWVRATAAK